MNNARKFSQIQLQGTQLRVSRFIFGTASLFNVGSERRRHALLDAAVNAGFTHFDTAPYYGFGWAERDLGWLIQRHPSLTVTTKVGIYSPGGEEASRLAVFLRKAGGRAIPVLSRPTIDFSVARAKLSLDASLRRLRSDRVSLYMLHEPELELVASEEWQRWLEREVTAGRVGAFGLALTGERLVPFLRCATGLAPVVQVLDSLERREADALVAAGRPLQITYGYVSAGQAAGANRTVNETLRLALKRNEHGAIIVSTTRTERLHQYAALLGAT